MKPAANTTALRVQQHLGADFQVLEFEESTRTSDDAARAIGCTVAEIAKSLIFKCKASDRGVLIVMSGVNRADMAKAKAVLGEKLSRADADFVRQKTGYAIGGVPPVAHAEKLQVLLDRDLLAFDEIWAAAGTPNAVFRLTPAQLQALTGGDWHDLAA